ncbi:DUF3180 domain-containing protein [Nesterenkonia halobia]|uniref:DUF3180 domain-containing protein n=1 Tax=Nesterenkonia halobia TaxID=37922 RepID=A0ABP6R9L1_9MICC
MTRLRPLWLLVIAVVAAASALPTTAVLAGRGVSSPALPPSSLITLGGVGCVVLGLGIAVRRDQRRLEQEAERRRRAEREHPETPPRRGEDAPRPSRTVHPLDAVRVVAAGQACAYAGALIAGWHVGVATYLGMTAGLGAPRVSSSLMLIIGGMIWVIIGFVVEQLCRIPPDRGSAAAASADGTDEGPDGSRPEEGYARGTH